MLKGIVVIVGHSGSGKTEVSINLAINQVSTGHQVKIADLDLINPYFRTREVKHFLNKRNIEVILPPEEYLNADLPILTPSVSGMIKNSPQLLLLDVGGGGVGSRVLGSLFDFFTGKNVEVLYIINPNRPCTDTIKKCLEMCREIESASKIRITGIISNANVMERTSVDDVYKGYDFAMGVSDKMNISISFITAPVERMSNLDFKRFKCPVVPIWRQLVPPWIQPEPLT